MRFLLLLLLPLFVFASPDDTILIDNLTQEEKLFLQEHQMIRVSNEKDWAPYDYNENGVAKGYAIDYLNLLAKKLNVEFVYVTDSWANLISKIKNKEIDLIHPISYSKKREAFLNYSKPFITSDMSIITTDTNHTIRSLEDFRFKTIAVGKGWKVAEYLRENYPEINFKEYETSKEKLEAVAFGEAEACLESFMTANYIKQRYLLSNLKVVKRITIDSFNRNHHIASRKDWTIMPSIINKAIESITEEEMLTLNRKWMSVKKQEINLTAKEEQFLINNPIIKIRASKDYHPFSFTNKRGESIGYIIDYTDLLARKLGLGIEYITEQTWQAAISDLKNKKIDVLPMMKKTPDREKYAIFSNPILETYIGIAALENRIEKINLMSLSNRKVGVLKGYWFLKNLRKYYPYLNLVYFDSNEDALVALNAGDVEAVISTEPVLNYIIKENYLIKVKTKPILNNPYLQKTVGHYAVRNDWEIFNTILRKAMYAVTDEELHQLKLKWFGTQESFSNPLGLEFTNEELNYLKNKGAIKMCIDPNWLPYEKFQKGKHVGMTYDYFTFFRSLIPIPIKTLQTKTWQESLESAVQRKCDIISLALETPTRKLFMDFPATYLKLPLVVATTPDKPFISSVNDVIDKPLGVVQGYAYAEILKSKYPEMNIVEIKNMKEGFAQVLSGKLYGVIDSLASLGYTIQNDYLGNLKIAGRIEETFHIGVAVRNDEKLLSSIFDKVIKSIDEKAHTEILNKWVGVKYDKAFDYTFFWQLLAFVSVIVAFLVYRQYVLKRQNDILQASNDEFAQLLDSTLEAIYILEKNRCIEVNKEGIQLLGFNTRDEVIGLHALDVIESSCHEIVKSHLESEAEDPYEAKVVQKDGTIVPVLIKGRNFILRNKKVRITAMVDLTELKHKERLLSENTKMVALGEMLSNIAHQWRQPLSIISTVASGVQMQKELGQFDEQQVYNSMEDILNNTQYLSRTIDDFRDFIKEDKEHREFRVIDNIEKTQTILTSVLRLNSINLIVDINPDIKLNSLENELSQVIMNLINNAKDAFNEHNIEPRYIFIGAQKMDNKVILDIKDNAGGIPEEIIEKVFEPYFTTKHKSQGTGLGLYMTNKIIVESMGGSIELTNVEYRYEGNSYKGANFRLTL